MYDSRRNELIMVQIQEIFGYKFKDSNLLKIALTHPSRKNTVNYQKFEFLGDRVLGLIMAEYVFGKFPGESEGDLAKRQVSLVCGTTLADIAKEQNIGKKLAMSMGEEQTGGRDNPSNLEDAMEAIIAAIYLDCNDLEKTKEIILKLWDTHLTAYKDPPQDPKSKLQEYLQANQYPLPEYKVVDRTGAAHEPTFTMELAIKGKETITVQAPSKKKGERELAELMLKQFEDDK